MIHGPEFSKWMELRAKTDRQLAVLLNRTVASGVRLAVEGCRTEAPDLSARARKAYVEVQRLMPLLRGGATPERHRLERELARLRRLLNEETFAEARVGAACS